MSLAGSIRIGWAGGRSWQDIAHGAHRAGRGAVAISNLGKNPGGSQIGGAKLELTYYFPEE